ncbi:uncharacterized protein Tco025E_06662 [Trypanosoma conorhini]|uniref:Uncharacterized protein n=1 Tax=Trypanosoma conorhini TaxID=83891 RepID=A0A422P0Y5_9TRYP|nr:uncharacterized protein Tco025E_06662 [Trypanosoma conorhini]RNF11368.1 hypothetical protein Tco025E_06662 [Trypanosoma conorhini]
MDFSGLGAAVVVLCVLIFGIVVFFLCTLVVRQRQMLVLNGVIEGRQRQIAEAAMRDNDRARSRRQLMRQAIDQLVEGGEASYGTVLVSEAQGTEVLADRRLRSYRGSYCGDALLEMRDGTRATVSEIVAMLREEPTPPPEAEPGPSLLQLLVEAASRRAGARGRRSSSSEPVGTLLEQLQHLQEEEAEEEEMREEDALADAEELYGRGLPYLLNPANEAVVYVADAGDDYAELLRRRQRQRDTSTLEWLLTPLLKRKGGPSFECPGRAPD